MIAGAHMDSPVERREVLIVGGGIAGIEALMALSDLGDHRLRLRVVASKPSFVLRPQILGEPWGGPPLRIDLSRLCRAFGADFMLGTVIAVDAEAQSVRTSGGETISYERLLLAPGARAALSYTGTHTIGFGPLPSSLASDGGGSVAIVAPTSASWTLPAYELGLLVAGSGRDVRVATKEWEPLEAFGPATHVATRAMFERHGVVVDPRGDRPQNQPVAELADTVVSLPLLNGPAIDGLPLDDHGFVHVDANLAVLGLDHVHAAGDATDGPIKQGGLGAQQADAAAAEIVRSCGGEPPEVPYVPVLRGKLTATDGDELYLRRALDGVDPGTARDMPLWQPPSIVCAWRLARWLNFRRDELDEYTLDHVARPSHVR